jgi:NAD(P) transhydrogenase subunit alpha
VSITIAIPKETASGEKRVAMEPSVATKLLKQGVNLLIEPNAGQSAYYSDSAFAGATFSQAPTLYSQADIILRVQMPNLEELEHFKSNSVLIGMLNPYQKLAQVKVLAEKGITSFAMELIPRISRAQAMDVLSSQAAVAGYKAAIMGANLSCRFFPMLTTAAGTIRPSKVIVVGAGVAGLQAIATARRLGAIVEAYDVRTATKEQVQSLGAKFIELGIKAEGSGGYARELTPEEQAQQQVELAQYFATADVLITTAAIPGKPSPKIISAEMVKGMKQGVVIIDLAAEGGGNCALTVAGETVVQHGVTIHAPLNVPSQVPTHASEMYAKNLLSFLGLVLKGDQYQPDFNDEIIKGALLTHQGQITNESVRRAVEA